RTSRQIPGSTPEAGTASTMERPSGRPLSPSSHASSTDLARTWPDGAHSCEMKRARRHHRALAAAAFGLLALVAELVGRSLTHRLDVGRHVESPSYSGADYYPLLLAFVKVGIALLLARLAWRFVRARAAARAARRVLAAVGKAPTPAPRVRLELSPRLPLAAFAGP